MTISLNPEVGDGFLTLGCTSSGNYTLYRVLVFQNANVRMVPFFRVLWSPVPKQRKQVREEFSRGIDTRCSSQFAQNATAQRMPKKV